MVFSFISATVLLTLAFSSWTPHLVDKTELKQSIHLMNCGHTKVMESFTIRVCKSISSFKFAVHKKVPYASSLHWAE